MRRWNKKIHTKLSCASDEGGKRGRIIRVERIPGIRDKQQISFKESPSQLYYSGNLLEKRKIYPGGRQRYAVM